MLNDQKIYAHLASHPGARATEIADITGATLAEVSASLRALVDVGDVVKSTHFDDVTSRQCQVYELSDQYKKSREGKVLFAEVPEKATTDSAPVAKGMSKVDRAIAHLYVHGSATDDELRSVMDIGRNPPAAYLVAALKSGRVIRDGSAWNPGSGRPAETPAPTRPQVSNSALVDTAKPVEAAIKSRKQVPGTVTQQERRCGIWSDGTVELQRNGRLQAQMSREDAEYLVDFILSLRSPPTTEATADIIGAHVHHP